MSSSPPTLFRQPWPQLSLLMTSLAIGQISLDVRTLNECFSVHYLCKLETKHPKHGLIIVLSAKFYTEANLSNYHISSYQKLDSYKG